MTAASADRNTVDAGIRKMLRIPVAAATTIYLGTMVCRDSSGNAVPAADTAGLTMAGVSKGDLDNLTSTVDNSAGSAGDLYVDVYRSGVYEFVGSGLTKADVGKPAYVSDDQTITLTPTNVLAGYIADFEEGSSTKAIVDIGNAIYDDPQEHEVLAYGVKTGTTIVVNTMVAVDSTGYLVPAADTAGLEFVGIALEGVVNAGASGSVDCLVRRDGIQVLTAAGLAVTDTGKALYATNATTVQTTPANLFVGKLAYFSAATEGNLDMGAALNEPATPARGRHFLLQAAQGGTVGAGPNSLLTNFEMPVPFKVLRGYADVLTAPGAGKATTLTITDGVTPKTVTISDTATHGEDEAINTVYDADTDIDITSADDGVGADLNVVFVCEEI